MVEREPLFKQTELDDLVRLAFNLQMLTEEGHNLGEMEDIVWTRIREELERRADEGNRNPPVS